MMRLLSLLGGIPQSFMLKVATHLLALTIGMWLANDWATERALQRELQASADRQRENHKQLIAWKNQTETKLKAEAEQQRAADQEAFRVYQQALKDTQRARNAALAALERERAANVKLVETTDGLRKVNEILAVQPPPKPEIVVPPSPGCVLSGELRVKLNTYIDSINAVANPEATPPGVPHGPDTDNTPIACADLAASLTDVLDHDAMMIAWVLSFQSWSNEALR